MTKHIPELLRSVIYFSAGLEFVFLLQIYWYGYKRFRKGSKIIKALNGMFLVSSVYFFYLAILPIIHIFNLRVYEFLVRCLPFFVIPIIISSICFHKYSLDNE